jgi:putative FmdB family regulatory protein
MPIYEFYCPDCDTLFNFFSSRIDTDSRPDCPRCGRKELGRRPARFAAITRSGGGEAEPEGFGGVDEERLGAAFESVLGDMEASGADAEDPRQMARMLRAVGEAAGLAPGEQMEEMLRRLEAGEDAERLEEEMGDAFDTDDDDPDADPLAALFQQQRRARGRRRRPKVDDELYFL